MLSEGGGRRDQQTQNAARAQRKLRPRRESRARRFRATAALRNKHEHRQAARSRHGVARPNTKAFPATASRRTPPSAKRRNDLRREVGSGSQTQNRKRTAMRLTCDFARELQLQSKLRSAALLRHTAFELLRLLRSGPAGFPARRSLPLRFFLHRFRLGHQGFDRQADPLLPGSTD